MLVPIFAAMLACAFAPMAFAAEDISGAQVSVADQTYNGTAQQPYITVTLGGKTLNAASDYNVQYTNNVNAGNASVTIVGTGDYVGTRTATFVIKPVDINNVYIDVAAQEYTGKKIKALPLVHLNKDDYTVMFTRGSDYSLKWGANKKIGKKSGKIVLTGKGNLTGKRTVSFKITKASVESMTVSRIKDATFTGNPIKPTPAVKYKKKVMKNGRDYVLKYRDNVNAGTATLIIKGKNSFQGKKEITFTIDKKDLKNAVDFSGLKKQYKYTGSAIQPNMTLKVNGKTLEENKDYTLSYSNNVNLGTARITVLGKGNYTGSDYGTFQIVQKVAKESKQAA